MTTAVATDAVTLKRFFRARYGLAVRVRTTPTQTPWVQVWTPLLPRDPRNLGGPLRYSGELPEELGRACIDEVYGSQFNAGGSPWAGNVERHSIAMSPAQWAAVLGRADWPPAD